MSLFQERRAAVLKRITAKIDQLHVSFVRDVRAHDFLADNPRDQPIYLIESAYDAWTLARAERAQADLPFPDFLISGRSFDDIVTARSELMRNLTTTAASLKEPLLRSIREAREDAEDEERGYRVLEGDRRYGCTGGKCYADCYNRGIRLLGMREWCYTQQPPQARVTPPPSDDFSAFVTLPPIPRVALCSKHRDCRYEWHCFTSCSL